MKQPIPVSLISGVPRMAPGSLFASLLNPMPQCHVALISETGGWEGAITVTMWIDGVWRSFPEPDYLSALRRLVTAPHYVSRIVLNATGMTFGEVERLFWSDTLVSSSYVLDITVAVLDLTAVPPPDEWHSAARVLIGQADTILMTSTRSASAKLIAMIAEHIRQKNGRARVVDVGGSDMALASVLYLGPALGVR